MKIKPRFLDKSLINLFGFLLPFSVAGCYIILGVLFLVWLSRAKFNDTFKILQKSTISQWAIVWLCLHILGVLWVGEFQQASITIKKSVYMAFIPVMMYFFRPSDAKNTFAYFLGGVFIYHIIVYGIHFNLWTVQPMQIGGTPFINRVHYSPMLVFAMLILYYHQKQWPSSLRIFSWAIQISFTISLIMTEGRLGQLLLFVAVPALIYLETKKIWPLLIGLKSVVILIITLSLFSQTFSDRFYELKTTWESFRTTGNTHSSVGERAHHIDASLKLISERPLLGFGTGSYLREHKRLLETDYPPNTINSDHPHNQYLQTMVQFGFLGLLVIMMLLPLMIYDYLKFFDHPYRNLLILYPVGFFITMLADDFMYGVPTMTMFMFMVTILYHPDWESTNLRD